ncbi:hypothetical protein [Streptosporangium sp. NPDC087985]|uniref:hypothetical protein n=1 Tax=Streptosporangium sp. NPDC087985 TaxID=3366196 RepID=UPI00383013A1
MRRPFPLAVAGWLITGSLATTAGVAVINLLGESLTSSAHRPLSSAEIGEALAAGTPAPEAHPTAVTSHPTVVTSHPTSTPAVPPIPKDRSRLISTEGGTVIARCEKGLVTLRSWSPAEGFQIKSVDRGPDDRARVEFESDETKVKVEVRCSSSGSPVHTVDD